MRVIAILKRDSSNPNPNRRASSLESASNLLGIAHVDGGKFRGKFPGKGIRLRGGGGGGRRGGRPICSLPKRACPVIDLARSPRRSRSFRSRDPQRAARTMPRNSHRGVARNTHRARIIATNTFAGQFSSLELVFLPNTPKSVDSGPRRISQRPDISIARERVRRKEGTGPAGVTPIATHCLSAVSFRRDLSFGVLSFFLSLSTVIIHARFATIIEPSHGICFCHSRPSGPTVRPWLQTYTSLC